MPSSPSVALQSVRDAVSGTDRSHSVTEHAADPLPEGRVAPMGIEDAPAFRAGNDDPHDGNADLRAGEVERNDLREPVSAKTVEQKTHILGDVIELARTDRRERPDLAATEDRVGIEIDWRGDDTGQILAAALDVPQPALRRLGQRTCGRDASVRMGAAAAVRETAPGLSLDDRARQRWDPNRRRDVAKVDGEAGPEQLARNRPGPWRERVQVDEWKPAGCLDGASVLGRGADARENPRHRRREVALRGGRGFSVALDDLAEGAAESFLVGVARCEPIRAGVEEDRSPRRRLVRTDDGVERDEGRLLRE